MANPNPSQMTRFTSDNQPENKGRRKNLIKQRIEDERLSRGDIREMLCQLASIKSMDEAKQMLLDQDTTFLAKLFLKPIINDYKYSKINTITYLLEYSYGRPKQVIETRDAAPKKPETKLTDQEVMEKENELLKSIILKNAERVKQIMIDEGVING